MADYELTVAEERLVEAARAGLPCELVVPGSEYSDPQSHSSWGDDRVIRAEVLSELCAGDNKDWKIKNIGVILFGARVTGILNLQGARVACGVALVNCVFDSPIVLTDANVRSLNLIGSWTVGILASRCEIDGALFMQNGFVCRGEVTLTAARVSGSIECDNGTFLNPDGTTLNLDSLSLGGSLFLRGEFISRGKIRMHGARVGGDLTLSGRLLNPFNTALAADQLNIRGSMNAHLLCVRGSLRFPRAQINGYIEFSHVNIEDAFWSPFYTPRPVLIFSLADVSGLAAFTEFRIVGGVALDGMNIRGGLSWKEGEIFLPADQSFFLDGTSIEGFLTLKEIKFLGQGEVVFAHVTAKVLSDDEQSWPDTGRLILDGLNYQQLSGTSPSNWKARLRWLNLQRREHLQKEFRTQPFEQLSLVFRRMGLESDARHISIEKQNSLRLSGTLSPWGVLWNQIFRFVLGYGYKPVRAIAISAFIVFLGAGLFWFADNRGEMVPAKALSALTSQSGNARALPPEYPKFNALLYSLDTFLPVVSLRQDENWVPRNDANLSWLLWSYVCFLIASGWLLTSLLVASLTGLIKKD